MTDIEAQARCSCRTPEAGVELPYCNGVTQPRINYPVWTALLASSTVGNVETSVSSLYTDTTNQLNSLPGISCSSTQNSCALLAFLSVLTVLVKIVMTW